MKRFVAGVDREQSTLLPECLGDFIDESNPVRVIDAFVDALDLAELGFDGVEPAATGRPSYHPSILLKLYIYGYLNRGACANIDSYATSWTAHALARLQLRKKRGSAPRQSSGGDPHCHLAR